MFSELDTAAEGDKQKRERVMEDVLAGVLTDLNVANVLMAAGQTLGEMGQKAGANVLDEALLRLENTTRIIEQSLPVPLSIGAEPGRFGFAEAAAELIVADSADLPSAIEGFRKRSNETLDDFVDQAKGVAVSIVAGLSKLDASKVLEALSGLGEKIEELPKVGRLFSQGIKKLQSAVDALMRLLGNDLLKKVKEQVGKIWNGFKDGKYVSAPLEWAFGIEGAKKEIEAALLSQGLNQQTLDEASNAVAKLRISFKENMGMLSGVVSAVSLAGTLLFIVPAIGQPLTLAAASIYVVILGAVVLIGMDYTDSGTVLKRIHGVGEIAKGLAS
ncbi:MAG TPA: hypothetical protein VK747_19520 [Blastocatellia bacterium]|nr:hypothetical protein [Blastocatellia bacterium]